MKEDIDQLRQLIRDLDLEWLDEELEEIISRGKLQQKDVQEGKRKTSKGIEQVPFTEDEQLDIVLNSIRNYFVALPQVQEDMEKTLRDSLNVDNINFIETEGEEFKRTNTETSDLIVLLNAIKS